VTVSENEKLRILTQLSRSNSEKATAALEKALASADTLLCGVSDYHSLQETLEELSIYGHKLPDEVLLSLRRFLGRLQKSLFVACPYAWESPEEMQARLTVKTLELVEQYRYFDMRTVIDILMTFSDHSNEAIAKAANEALRKCASYNISIFYAGRGRAGLGASPQLEIISYLEANQGEFNHRRIDAVQSICGPLLSSTMEDTSWDYQSVTWSRGSVPVCDPILEVRARTIAFLKNIYNLERPISDRLSIIRSLMTSMEVPRTDNCPDDLKAVVISDTLNVLDWLKGAISTECFPVLQKIEHDVYWRYYHGISEEIRNSCLEIRDVLYTNFEYLIYRNLIGFESVFEDWKESLTSEKDFELIEKQRKEKASEYANSINHENWVTWKQRILEFCKTESNDLATFPIFYEFLRVVAEHKPSFALELVSVHLEEIEKFTIPIYRGLWNGNLHNECRDLLLNRCSQGQQLAAIAKLFLWDVHPDHELLTSVLSVASERGDEYILALLLEVAASQFERDENFAKEGLFVPAIQTLKMLHSKYWVHTLWYRREVRKLVGHLNLDEMRALIDALVFAERIEFQTEELLKPVAENAPELVLELFKKRISFKGEQKDYEPIPFDFHALSAPLSRHPDLVVRTIRSWYKADDYLFQYRGARLLGNIFPGFGEGIATELIRLVRSGDQSDARFVLSVLRNYEGQLFLHPICRELVVCHHDNEEIMNETTIALISTGVVHGEYGMAEAYAKKASEIEYWLNDSDESVRGFAQAHIESLLLTEKRERERATEEIELRKHRYGVTDE
jgi:hypothetical protein